MKINLIKIFPGDYSNLDAYNRITDYILQKPYVGGYGFTLPLTKSTVIKQLEASNLASTYNGDRFVWHFIISIPRIKKHSTLLLLAEKIATLFTRDYQILYALDLDPGHYHLHFAINAYSYHPN